MGLDIIIAFQSSDTPGKNDINYLVCNKTKASLAKDLFLQKISKFYQNQDRWRVLHLIVRVHLQLAQATVENETSYECWLKKHYLLPCFDLEG